MTHTIQVELPDALYRHISEIAAATQRSVEDLARQSVAGNLPPFPSTSDEKRAGLLKMQKLSVDELREVAVLRMPAATQARHEYLLEQNSVGSLTEEERAELVRLRMDNDMLMLRKAYAWALLRWHGVPVPALNDMPLA